MFIFTLRVISLYEKSGNTLISRKECQQESSLFCLLLPWSSNGSFYTLEGFIFWDITPCSPLKVNQHFEITCRLHPNQCFLLTLKPWRWDEYVPPKRWLTGNWLRGVISQKIKLFITTVVRISNLTFHSLFYIYSYICIYLYRPIYCDVYGGTRHVNDGF
jgi:hypothetical protein